MSTRYLRASAAGVFFAILISACASTLPSLHGSVYNPPREAPPLNLQTTSGADFELSSYAGDVVLVYFGYTYCPDVCPATLAQVKLAFETLGSQADELHLVMVTVDLDRDTPQVLQDYLGRFHPEFVGLRGESDALESVLADYGVFAQKEPSDDADAYLVTHTARLFVIDRDGLLKTNYTFGTPLEEIQADLKVLLSEQR